MISAPEGGSPRMLISCKARGAMLDPASSTSV
jgi:hypothetical protein